MGISNIRKAYGLPAKIGSRIKYTDDHGSVFFCTIKSVRDEKLRVLVDDRVPNYRGRMLLHPTNNIEYLWSRQNAARGRSKVEEDHFVLLEYLNLFGAYSLDTNI